MCAPYHARVTHNDDDDAADDDDDDAADDDDDDDDDDDAADDDVNGMPVCQIHSAHDPKVVQFGVSLQPEPSDSCHGAKEHVTRHKSHV